MKPILIALLSLFFANTGSALAQGGDAYQRRFQADYDAYQRRFQADYEARRQLYGAPSGGVGMPGSSSYEEFSRNYLSGPYEEFSRNYLSGNQGKAQK
jgi:hypothetical protein